MFFCYFLYTYNTISDSDPLLSVTISIIQGMHNWPMLKANTKSHLYIIIHIYVNIQMEELIG